MKTKQSHDIKQAATGASAAPSDFPELDLETPLYNEEAVHAEKERQAAAAAAFRNEKAHERPPRHQA
ncbi:MAG TPA: hypothetical protein VED87_12255 [Methylocystis sp.]|nr:hypothetical protein [Methylocystis sp.]